MRKRKVRAIKGSGNVFADLGLPNPEQELLKARLTLQIYEIVKKRRAKPAGVTGVNQPAVVVPYVNMAYLPYGD